MRGGAAMAGNIFINYRREDSSGTAGRLHDRLDGAFGRDKLFIDVDNIPVGMDFEAHLKSQVEACDVMLAIIGPRWLGSKDELGQRRLDNPEDFVAIELAAALDRKIPVIPVLVDGARMPKASELPESLKPLARRQSFGLRHEHFGADAETLIGKMRQVLKRGEPDPKPKFSFARTWVLCALVATIAAGAGWFVIGPPKTATPCVSGYVWRLATPGDHVCVTPETHEQALRDNMAAAARREPRGGAYGPDTCKTGFVWREAYGDTVCVTRETRDKTRNDNRDGPSRVAR